MLVPPRVTTTCHHNESEQDDMATRAETAVRNYLVALKNPSSLRDEDEIKKIRQRVDSSKDELERLKLRQQMLDLERPSEGRYEDAFVKHAKAWADKHGIGAKAFTAEGVSPTVLRKAGFTVDRGRGRGRRRAAPRRRTGKRVTVAEVRSAIPRGTFTIKRLQEKSGASPAVVRKVLAEEEAAGNVSKVGPDPDHKGPGRAPTLYKKG
jgi:hypothetical protein